jgi:cell division protease FtsH
MSKSQMIDTMTSALGGRAAEQIVFNEVWTGAQSDLEKVTDMARRMVCEFGMSENLGPLTLGRRNGPVFLGRDFHEERNYSEEVAAKIDIEIRNLVDSSYDNAVRLLTENRDIMDRIVQVLLEKETISGDELERLMNGGEIEPPIMPSEPPVPPQATPTPVDQSEPEKKRLGGFRPGLAGA